MVWHAYSKSRTPFPHVRVHLGRTSTHRGDVAFTRRSLSAQVAIDGRDVGRPICYRSWQSYQASFEEILRLVDTELPAGHQAHIFGDTDDEPKVFLFQNGAKVIIRVAQVGPQPYFCLVSGVGH